MPFKNICHMKTVTATRNTMIRNMPISVDVRPARRLTRRYSSRLRSTLLEAERTGLGRTLSAFKIGPEGTSRVACAALSRVTAMPLPDE